MSSEHTSASETRSSRKGRRRTTRPRNRQETPAPLPQKETWWQKITAFFLGKNTQTAPPKRSLEKSDFGNGDTAVPGKRPVRSAGFRKPETVEVSSPRIYVGNLSFEATEGDLFELFSGVGTVQNVEIVSNKHTQKSKGFAFVQMQTIDEAKRAVAELHDKDYMGRKLVVSGAKAVDEKRGERRHSEQ
jgi:RNA recognition motif-containing protein